MNSDMQIKKWFEAMAKQIDKRDISLDDLFLFQSRENQMFYWPLRSRAGEYYVLFFFSR